MFNFMLNKTLNSESRLFLHSSSRFLIRSVVIFLLQFAMHSLPDPTQYLDGDSDHVLVRRASKCPPFYSFQIHSTYSLTSYNLYALNTVLTTVYHLAVVWVCGYLDAVLW